MLDNEYSVEDKRRSMELLDAAAEVTEPVKLQHGSAELEIDS